MGVVVCVSTFYFTAGSVDLVSVLTAQEPLSVYDYDELLVHAYLSLFSILK